MSTQDTHGIWPWSGHHLVEGHFAGANGARADRRMWRHLRPCEDCRVQYGTHALCEAAAPDGDQRAQDRLARAVFAPVPAPRIWLGVGAALAAGAAALLLVPHLAGQSTVQSGMQERGGAVVAADSADRAGPTIALYRVAAAGSPERAGAVIHASDALAFSYTNPADGDAGFSHLMIFAHDSAGHVFWYWPAWRDAAATPTAIAITRGKAPVELGEAVRHPLPPGGLTLTALFTNQAYDVRQVEAALAGGAAGLAALHGRLVHEQVEVLP
jgi:hypothetical protein